MYNSRSFNSLTTSLVPTLNKTHFVDSLLLFYLGREYIYSTLAIMHYKSLSADYVINLILLKNLIYNKGIEFNTNLQGIRSSLAGQKAITLFVSLTS